MKRSSLGFINELINLAGNNTRIYSKEFGARLLKFVSCFFFFYQNGVSINCHAI